MGHAGLEHLQDGLAVLGIVLVPGVVEGLPGPRDGEGGHQMEGKAVLLQVVGQGTMVVARRLKPDEARLLQGLQIRGKLLEVRKGIGHLEALV